MRDKLDPLIIGDLEIKIPIIQGGMGVRVSLAPLAAAVANCGAAGTIASVGLPDPDAPETLKDVPAACCKEFIKDMKAARELSDGAIGVNIMVALGNYEEMVKATINEDIDYIVSGAGLPISLPEFAEGSSAKLIPMLSSARGAAVILKTWKRRYNRLPDAIIVEGPLSGGHIATLSVEELRALGSKLREKPRLEESIKDVVKLVSEYEKDYGVSIPVIAAGGIFDGKDIAKFFKLGAKGVQLGSRFVTTEECSVAQEFKDLYINSTEEDLAYIQSPVGMPAKVIRTKFIDAILKGEKKPIDCSYICLRTCDPNEAHFCIARALVSAARGDIDNAIVLAGSNVSRITKIVPVQELIDELVSGTLAELNKETVDNRQ
ncbi:MAG: nitronate monooxygenase [Candidatus Omnitrophica bacterium]|nr:nitronate monooxygenase [Candidatus Omnitrophota bacterium]